MPLGFVLTLSEKYLTEIKEILSFKTRVSRNQQEHLNFACVKPNEALKFKALNYTTKRQSVKIQGRVGVKTRGWG